MYLTFREEQLAVKMVQTITNAKKPCFNFISNLLYQDIISTNNNYITIELLIIQHIWQSYSYSSKPAAVR